MAYETGHFYDRDGTPRHFVERAKGGGQRPSTLADAKKHGWLPSVTQVLKVLNRPGLEVWKQEQIALACLTTPRLDKEDLHEFYLRVTRKEALAESEAAKGLGIDLHEASEQYLAGLPEMVKPDLLPWIEPACKHLLSLGTVLATEEILVGDGYAGKFDVSLKADNEVVIVDIKTTKTLPEKPWKEWRLQLSAYAAAFSKNSKEHIRTANLAISTKDKGSFLFLENTSWQADFTVFEYLFETWTWLNEYRPGEEVKP